MFWGLLGLSHGKLSLILRDCLEKSPIPLLVFDVCDRKAVLSPSLFMSSPYFKGKIDLKRSSVCSIV